MFHPDRIRLTFPRRPEAVRRPTASPTRQAERGALEASALGALDGLLAFHLAKHFREGCLDLRLRGVCELPVRHQLGKALLAPVLARQIQREIPPLYPPRQPLAVEP